MKSYKTEILVVLSFFIIVNTNADDKRHINELLDGLHNDAHKGNFDSYFDRYSSDAVFLGTDKTERWTIEKFKNYAKPAFADGHGWTYKVIERNWEGDGDIQWFDEILFNEKLGYCRGTGVVELINGEWKIAHYALTMLIPNSIAAEVGSKTIEVDRN
jgi:hypothetical protein